MPDTKLVQTYAQIQKRAKNLKQNGKKIVLTQGSFDMLHIGHGRYLHEARRHGDVLIVGVDSDAKIQSRKGPDRPVVPEDERLEMLTYLESVDHVVLKDVTQPKWELIKVIQPDVLIAVQETYTPEQVGELETFCGEVVILERMATTSTSAKIRLVQVGAAKRLSTTISTKLVAAMESILEDLKTELQQQPQ